MGRQKLLVLLYFNQLITGLQAIQSCPSIPDSNIEESRINNVDFVVVAHSGVSIQPYINIFSPPFDRCIEAKISVNPFASSHQFDLKCDSKLVISYTMLIEKGMAKNVNFTVDKTLSEFLDNSSMSIQIYMPSGDANFVLLWKCENDKNQRIKVHAWILLEKSEYQKNTNLSFHLNKFQKILPNIFAYNVKFRLNHFVAECHEFCKKITNQKIVKMLENYRLESDNDIYHIDPMAINLFCLVIVLTGLVLVYQKFKKNNRIGVIG